MGSTSTGSMEREKFIVKSASGADFVDLIQMGKHAQPEAAPEGHKRRR